MKILYVGNIQGLGNISKYYLTEQRILNGMTRLGHSVYCFNDRDYSRYANLLRTQSLGKEKMNKQLVEAAKVYEPEIIILSHCKNVETATLEKIRTILPDIRMMYTNVDPLTSKNNLRDIRQRVGVVDSIFITTAGAQLQQFSNRRTSVRYFPNPVDSAIDRNCAYENPNAHIDLLLLGRALTDQHDHRRHVAEAIIEKNKGYITHFIGGMGVNDSLHYGAEYMKILNSSKMGVSLSKVDDHYLYASDRLSHYLSSGIATFIPTGSDFEDILGKGAFIEFNEFEDLWEKALYYAERNEERKKIAKTGYERSRRIFSADRVCAYLLEATQEKSFSQDYEWPTRAAKR